MSYARGNPTMGSPFRSKCEERFAAMLVRHRIPYQFEPHRFKLPNRGGYTPDFLVRGSEWVEVKSGTGSIFDEYMVRTFMQIRRVMALYGTQPFYLWLDKSRALYRLYEPTDPNAERYEFSFQRCYIVSGGLFRPVDYVIPWYIVRTAGVS